MGLQRTISVHIREEKAYLHFFSHQSLCVHFKQSQYDLHKLGRSQRGQVARHAIILINHKHAFQHHLHFISFPLSLIGWTHSSVGSHEGFPLRHCWTSESLRWSSHGHRSYSSALSSKALSSCPTGSARFIFLLPQPDSLTRPAVNNRERQHLSVIRRFSVWETANEKCTSVRQSKMPWRVGFPKLPRRSPFALKHSYCSYLAGMVHCYMFWPSIFR